MSFPEPLSRKPVLAVLKWQLLITIVMAAGAAALSGAHGAISAVLGGIVNVSAVVLYWFVANVGLRLSKGGTGLWALLRAEGAKVAAILLQIVLVFKLYGQLVVPAFFITFLVTLLAWRVAFFVKT